MPKTDLLVKFLKTNVENKTFEFVCRKVKFLSADKGNCLATLKVEQEHTNPMGGLHGGFSSTLVDVISSLALFTHPKGERASVSVNINMSFLKGARIGDEILIDAKTLRAGRQLAFLEVEMRNKENNSLLIKGEHTKFFINP